jgi:hypothetical protein
MKAVMEGNVNRLQSGSLTCHLSAQASDWIYVGGYPALRR